MTGRFEIYHQRLIFMIVYLFTLMVFTHYIFNIYCTGFFFLMPFPFFAIRLLRYLFGRRFFLSNFFLPILSFLQVVRRGSGALSPRPPTPIPPHIHRHTQHLYTHGRLFPTGLEPVLTSRWCSKECRSSFHHPTVSP
jgi:hypothetical protein